MSSTASSSISSWQQLWESTQPRLEYIQQSLNLQNIPAPRVMRVGKLDAELLDQELGQILQEPLTKAFNLVNPSFKTRFEPELGLLIQLTLYKFSVWDTGASYGAKLQGLKYIAPHSSYVAASSLPRRLLLLHGVLTLFIPYIHTRIRAHALSHAWPDAPSSDSRRKAWELLTRLESTHGLLALLNFIGFLWNGRYRALADRLLDMRLVSAQRFAQRDVSYEFMNRQMVWHAFTEFLLFLLPIINPRALSRRLTRLASKFTLSSVLPSPLQNILNGQSAQKNSDPIRSRRGKYWALPMDQCAICYEDASTNLNLNDPINALTSLASSTYSATASSAPETTDGSDEEPVTYPIHTPYITECDHTYCYVCITGRMMRSADEQSGVGPGGTRWECLRCGEAVSSADRVEVEVEEVDSESITFDDGYEFGSDMSGSVGDDSESYTSE